MKLLRNLFLTNRFFIAFSIFIVIRTYKDVLERTKKEEEAKPTPPPAPSREEVLLTEIRDLLKEKNHKA